MNMQSTSFFKRPVFRVTTIAPDPDKQAAYMQASANLQALRKLDANAYNGMIARLDKGETWQALDVDVCHELDRLESLSEQAEMTAMQRGE